MLPALGIEGLGAVGGEERDGGTVAVAVEDAADSGDGDAGDLFWEASVGGGGEE